MHIDPMVAAVITVYLLLGWLLIKGHDNNDEDTRD